MYVNGEWFHFLEYWRMSNFDKGNEWNDNLFRIAPPNSLSSSPKV
jgi:hypothetical protein